MWMPCSTSGTRLGPHALVWQQSRSTLPPLPLPPLFRPLPPHCPVPVRPLRAQVPHLREADPELYGRIEALLGDHQLPPADGPGGAGAPGDSMHVTDGVGPGVLGGGAMQQLLGMSLGPQVAVGGVAVSRQAFGADPGAEGRLDQAGGDGPGGGLKPVLAPTPTSAMSMPGPALVPPPALPAVPPPPPGNQAAAQGGGGGSMLLSMDKTTSLGRDVMGELDKEGSMSLAAQVASSSLTPNAREAPRLAGTVNTESLESAAEKYRDFRCGFFAGGGGGGGGGGLG
jgi:CCR4-NOT transcription complex subunit 1